ncbi:conserved domain protein [Luminiphilus syltensis NOR5-1B]|uniref:Conserved domain protein n=1 Tax=Luminiphilus syltensis NOR5-1B TaxID=565045 RepID=B8KTW6_9GAMM|nr:monodechloroaminopyrrolnitrin synthase PrnB family protein [Luminiphilus syltensis]EED34266.1 conserved domain protein [Luminiphilus syltensis NOR5-1B]
MTGNVENFDRWIRSEFADLNTVLENAYFQRSDRADVTAVGAAEKGQLRAAGTAHIVELLREGNTDEGFDAGFDLLGNVGLFMAACARHGIADQNAKDGDMPEASGLALQLGASLGVTPRFATSHLTTHNRAIDGRYKSFTTLRDDYLFTDYNTRGILGYKRAADALLRILPLGITHPVAADLLAAARDALKYVVQSNETLFTELDTDRFFYSVRPYFKPHRVGQHSYRGANAGDFAGINVIDMLLGLCRADHAYYSQLLVDKFLYMMPEDQSILRDCMRRRSLMDEFLCLPDSAWHDTHCRDNLALFLEVCDLHGQTATQHHNQLVTKFIEQPAVHIDDKHQENLTASGPPLEVLMRALARLRDLRSAADRDDIPSRYHDIVKLRAKL